MRHATILYLGIFSTEVALDSDHRPERWCYSAVWSLPRVPRNPPCNISPWIWEAIVRISSPDWGKRSLLQNRPDRLWGPIYLLFGCRDSFWG